MGKDVTSYVEGLERENKDLKEKLEKCKVECKPKTPRKLRISELRDDKAEVPCDLKPTVVVELEDKCLKEEKINE